MITDAEITPIGRFGQPHGIKGELNAVIDEPVDMATLSCIVAEIDGINVPFFISSIRSRSAIALLLTIEGVADEQQASMLQGKTIYALRRELPEDDADDDADGFYAEDLIGYEIIDSENGLRGKVTGIDDSTENVLFIVDDGGPAPRLIPVADEFIVSVDPQEKIIEMQLPEGLLDL